jgi:hypothetical protein
MKPLLVVLVATLPRLALAQGQPGAATPADSARYRVIAAEVLRGDTTADITALRLLYAKFGPSEGAPNPAQSFRSARATRSLASRRAILDTLLAAYAGHVRAHMDVERIPRETRDTVRADQEAAIVRAFIASIGQADGQTPESAMLVTSIDEEYAFLAARSVRRTAQSLVHAKTSRGHERFDLLQGVETATGRARQFYFRLNW